MYSLVWACLSIDFLNGNLQNVFPAVTSKIENTKRLPTLHSTALFASKRHSEYLYDGATMGNTNRDVTANMAAVLNCLLFSNFKNGK